MSFAPNDRAAPDAAVAFCWYCVALSRRASEAGRSPTMRAERAKLKSRRDAMTIAPGKRGTSAARGYTSKMISSFLPFRFAAPEERQTGKGEKDCGGRLFTPGGGLPPHPITAGQAAALPGATIVPPRWGSCLRRASASARVLRRDKPARQGGKANQRAPLDAAGAFCLHFHGQLAPRQ